jgi:glucose/arabinose dehydrogenase
VHTVLLLAAAVLLTVPSTPLYADVLPYGVKIEKMLDNGVDVGDLAQSPTGELWLLERSGDLNVLVAGVLDASLSIGVSASCESGLLDVAFAPDYPRSGRAFLYYVDTAGTARVDEVFRAGGSLSLGSKILDIGTVTTGCRPGGGLGVGPDGKLYVTTGDLDVPANAQDDLSLAGKVLRAELDGGVPADNPSGTLVWAKGFRNGKDLAINPTTPRSGGTLYLVDRGESTTVYDELNTVAEGGNHGWSTVSGPDPGYDDPLAWEYSVSPEGLEVLGSTALDAGYAGTLMYACKDADDIRQAFLTGTDLDQLDHWTTFYAPTADRDGTPDAGCPRQFEALAEGSDGWLYGTNAGANAGVWRMWRDLPGPREVSAPGSPFELTVGKSGSNLVIGWENLGTVDVGRPSRHATQHATTYQVWEGTLPIPGTYDHLVTHDTDGTPDGPARLTATITPGAGDRYYLVAAQGDNLEGPLGAGRPGESDYCDTIGRGNSVGDCAKEWLSPVDGKVMYLKDYNPNSPTHNQMLTMSDFRGQVVRMDISATDCGWCDIQADLFHNLDIKYRDRDMRFVTIMMRSYGGWTAIAPSECASRIETWANNNNELGPILCDTDLDGNGKADVAAQLNTGCGTPTNFYIDQGHVIYDYVCGAELSSSGIEARIAGEVNPETCE